jgi:transcriptional antiterminator
MAMSSLVPLDTRQARIAWRLLERREPVSIGEIAADLKLTSRVVRYNLPSVGQYLRGSGLRLVRRRGLGIWVDGDDAARRAAMAGLESAPGPTVMDVVDRRISAIAELLEHAPEPLRLEALERRLGVSRPTVRRDLRAAETWLENHRLHVQRLPGVGIVVRGTELDVRKGLVGIVLESLPAETFGGGASADQAADPGHVETGRGLSDLLASLELPMYRAILTEQFTQLDPDDPMVTTAALYVAIVTRRVAAGRSATLNGGQLRSLLDHPVGEAAVSIATAVESFTGVTLGDTDIAAITEFLLGFVELTRTEMEPRPEDVAAIDRLVETAAARLHPSLAQDEQLRWSLTEHLRRLRVRLRYGLPVTNPLHEEVRERFPEVYAVVADIAGQLGLFGSDGVPDEEVGFLTMYLAGSLERNRLHPPVRITVVCPAGMATAWILVSRLLAEFPHVDITQVVSKTAFDSGSVSVSESDLIVSTVPLDGLERPVPTVVVSPLLHVRDIRRVARNMAQLTH